METFKLVTVGAGTCVPQPGVASSCGLIEAGGRSWLVDVGTGAMQGLMEAGADVMELEGALLTHHHPDHSGELPALIQSVVWGSKRVRNRPFLVAGGPATRELVASWARFFGDWVYGRGFAVNVEELGHGDRLRLGELEVKVARLEHSESSVAYRFRKGDRSLVITGDTGPSDDLAELSAGANVLCIECSFPDEEPRPGHMTPTGVARISAAAGVERVVLTHLYPDCDPHKAVRTVSSRFSGQVILAEPGLELEV